MKNEPEIIELSEFLDEFNNESEKAAVLTAGAYLDQRLADVLLAFFAKVEVSNQLVFGFNAPHGSFSSRIKACYALGLIEEDEYDELNKIRKIRNKFAHSWQKVSFVDHSIKDLCNNLPWKGPKEIEAKSGARERFTFAVIALLSDLLWRVRIVEKERRMILPWKENRSVTVKIGGKLIQQ